MRRRCTEYVMLVVLWASWVYGAEPESVARLSAGWVVYYATVYHVPVQLVQAIIEVESGWEPYAVSPKGAVGLMQLMPATAYKFRVRNRFWVEENIRGGVAYPAWLIGLFHGDLRLAVASYYAGERRIMPQKPAYSSPEVYEYVERVAALFERSGLRRCSMEALATICLCGAVSATAQTVQPRILSEPAVDGHVTVVEVRTHFVTAIRMPEPVNSVAVGDPSLFQVEHSEREPNLVFVKSLTAGAAETNLLLSTGKGHETSLLLVSRGENTKDVDFVVRYRRAGSFLIEPDYPSPLVGETVPTTMTQVSFVLCPWPLVLWSPAETR